MTACDLCRRPLGNIIHVQPGNPDTNYCPVCESRLVARPAAGIAPVSRQAHRNSLKIQRQHPNGVIEMVNWVTESIYEDW